MLSSLLIIPLVFWAAAEGTDLSAKKSECYGVALILPGGSRICPNLLRFDEKLDCCAHTEESRKEVAAHNKTMTAMAADSALDRFLLRLRRKRCALCGAGHSEDDATTPQPHNPKHLIVKIGGKQNGDLLSTTTASPHIGDQISAATTQPPATTTHDSSYDPDYPMKTSPRCTSWRAARNEGGKPICPDEAPFDSKLDCCAVPIGGVLPLPSVEEMTRPRLPLHLRYVPSERCVWWRAPRDDDGRPHCPPGMPYASEFDCCALPADSGKPKRPWSPLCQGEGVARNEAGIPICPDFAPYSDRFDCCALPAPGHSLPPPNCAYGRAMRNVLGAYKCPDPPAGFPAIPLHLPAGFPTIPQAFPSAGGFYKPQGSGNPHIRCITYLSAPKIGEQPICSPNLHYESELNCCADTMFENPFPMPTCISGRAERNPFGVPKCPDFAPYFLAMDCCAIPNPKAESHIPKDLSAMPAKPSPRCLTSRAVRDERGFPMCPEFAPYEQTFDCCAIPLERWLPDHLGQPSAGMPTGVPEPPPYDETQYGSQQQIAARLTSPKCTEWKVHEMAPRLECPFYAPYNFSMSCCAIPAGFVMNPNGMDGQFPRLYCASLPNPNDSRCPLYAPYYAGGDCCALGSNWLPYATDDIRNALPTSRCTAHKAPRNATGHPVCPEYTAYERKYDCCAYPSILNAIELTPFPPSQKPEYAELYKKRCILWPENPDRPTKNDCPPNSIYAEKLQCCAVPVGSEPDHPAEDNVKVAKHSSAF